MRIKGARRLLFDARVLGDDGIGRVTRALLPHFVERASDQGFELAVLSRAVLPHLPRRQQVIDQSDPYSVEELSATAQAASQLRSDVFLSLDVKIGIVPPALKVVGIVHDLMRLYDPELCYSDEAIVQRWGAPRLESMRASVAELDAVVGDECLAPSPVHVVYCRLAAYWMIQRCELLVAPSKSSLDQIVRAKPLPRRSPIVLSWGLDHLTMRTEFSPAATRHLVYVGQDRPHKCLDVLLNAFQILREAEMDLELWLVGRDFAPDRVGHRYEGNRVRCLGPVSDEKLGDILANAAVFVQPSKDEGFGFGPFEALLAGTPILLGSAPVFREHFATLSPRDVGWIHGSEVKVMVSEVRRLLQYGAPLERGMRAARARARFKSATWENCAKDLLQIIADVEYQS